MAIRRHVGTTTRRAMKTFRPGYAFWRNIFTIRGWLDRVRQRGRRTAPRGVPEQGRLARLPECSPTPRCATLLDGRQLPAISTIGATRLCALLEDSRGARRCTTRRADSSYRPNADRYGDFLAEWGAIYERFGVPAEIGLAQAILESGCVATRNRAPARSASASGSGRNWKVLDKLAPATIEADNQTTQARVLRGVSDRARDQVSVVHPRAFGTPQRRHQRRPRDHQRRASGRH